mmetsp:Transcript_13406/g.19201  ORF Transcript_13406/g.19201 Transcript_13406/m.19201 type:complete len:204 (-) Transcript_13406:461-1072(-)
MTHTPQETSASSFAVNINSLQELHHPTTTRLFGETSKISMALKTWVHHLNRNKASYDSMQRSDCTFLSQLLYCIDMATQVHFTSCLTETTRADVNDDCLDFSVDQQNVTRRQFFITLPQAIKTLAQTVTPNDKTPTQDHHWGAKRSKMPIQSRHGSYKPRNLSVKFFIPKLKHAQNKTAHSCASSTGSKANAPGPLSFPVSNS